MEFNVYCDESSHLKSNKGAYMVIGSIYLPKHRVKAITKYLRDLKTKYKLDDKKELKWNKIKQSTEELYEDIIKYFFSDDDIKFRAIIINKNNINNKKYNQTEDEFYHKMYYDMLKYIFDPFGSYHIYPDIKDTHSYYNHQLLLDILRNKLKDFNKKTIIKIQPIKSYESILLQLNDIVIGALSHYYNYKDIPNNKSKSKIIDIITKNVDLNETTPYSDTKFNLLLWRSKNDIDRD